MVEVLNIQSVGSMLSTVRELLMDPFVLVQDLDEMNIEIIRNTLYKSYLESFYNFCLFLGGETADVMCEILAFEADRR